MVGSKKIFFAVGAIAIIGLGIMAYSQQTRRARLPSPVATTITQESRSNAVKEESSAIVVPSTPDTVVNDILQEAETDNLMLSEEGLGAVSAIGAEGAVVSDFGTIYDKNEN